MGQNSIHLHNVCFFYTSKQYIRVNDVIASSQRVFHLRALQSQMSGGEKGSPDVRAHLRYHWRRLMKIIVPQLVAVRR